MLETELKKNLRALGRAYLARRPYAQSTLWGRAAKDAQFMARLDSGKTFTVRTYDRTVQWFSDNWPEGPPRPKSVAPTPPKAAGPQRRPSQSGARLTKPASHDRRGRSLTRLTWLIDREFRRLTQALALDPA
jgi:hypothetical protein